MRSPGTSNSRMGVWNISDAGSRFGSTKPATIIVHAALILVALCSFLLIAASPAQGQTETVLYSFTSDTDGIHPTSRLTSDGAGDLYGTTLLGGPNTRGSVFELSPNGSGGWNRTTIYGFSGEADGEAPLYSYVTFDSAGNLYGTASFRGANGQGVVFELSPAGETWNQTVLYSFAGGTDGSIPVNGLIMDPAGNLFGTTLQGGSYGKGTVFELSPSPGGWSEQVIYNVSDGGYGGLTMDASGNIFGTTSSTVFELSPNGNGGWTPVVIHTFASEIEAYGTLVLDEAGNLYGTTVRGHGTVYRLSPVKSGKNKGKWKERILYTFKGFKENDGIAPWAGVVLDAAGNIYGTTADGGGYCPVKNGRNGCGAVFELIPSPDKASYTEKILWSFSATDGYDPLASLILDSAGNLYGTTSCGGSTYQYPGTCGVAHGFPYYDEPGAGNGVVFEVSP